MKSFSLIIEPHKADHEDFTITPSSAMAVDGGVQVNGTNCFGIAAAVMVPNDVIGLLAAALNAPLTIVKV